MRLVVVGAGVGRGVIRDGVGGAFAEVVFAGDLCAVGEGRYGALCVASAGVEVAG